MHYDKRGLAITTDSAAAVDHFDRAIASILAHRKDAGSHLAAALVADPGLVAAHATLGFAQMLLGRAELVAAARAHAGTAWLSFLERGGTPREKALVQALDLWIAGAMEASAVALERSLASRPLDALTFKLCYSLRFMLGDVAGMRHAAEASARAWSPAVPDHGFILGCQAFAFEEMGELDRADRVGRQAVEAEPLDAWGCHAVAHVFETRGEPKAGVDWFGQRRSGFAGLNNFARHLAWHEALFRLELGEFDAVLALYDRDIRGERTDDYRDIANAASLLWRLERRGVAVGQRWRELAELAEGRIGDDALVFAGLHYLMCLVADRRSAAAAKMLARVRRDALHPAGTQAGVLAEVGLPLAEIIADPRTVRADPASLEPLLARLGGSRAQRAVFHMVLDDAGRMGTSRPRQAFHTPQAA